MPERVTPKRPQGGPGSLFLIDGYNFIFRAYHALPLLNAPDGRAVHAVHGFVRMAMALRRDFQPESLIAVFDGGGDGNRRATYPEYKAQRPPPPDDLVPQFALVREATDALNIPRVEHSDYEADDVIASYAQVAHAAGKRVVIVSSDKDLMQLCTLGDEQEPSVLLWDTMKTKTMGPAEVLEKFGVLPDKLGDLLALMGDSSDNIPGVPGIGPKTAAQLLGEYGTLEGVLEAAPSIKQKKRRENLIAAAENARLSRKLVTLHTDVPLPLSLEQLVDPGQDEQKVIDFFEPLGFKQVIREVQNRHRRERAQLATDDPGAIEFERSPFMPHTDGYRWIMADQRPALDELVEQLRSLDEFALFLGVEGGPLRAELIGFAVAGSGIDPTYVPFGHRQADLVSGRQLGRDEVVDAFRPLLEHKKRRKIVHDVKLATHALRGVGVTLAGVHLDPMLVSYTVDPARSSHALSSLADDILSHKLATSESLLGKGRKAVTFAEVDPRSAGPWTCEHVEVTFALGESMTSQLQRTTPAIRSLLADVEMPLARVLVELEARGIGLDASVLERQSEALAKDVARIQGEVEAEAGHSINLDSPLQLQKLLFEDRELPPTRKLKTGYSTDAKALEGLVLLDPIVGKILDYRSVVKLKNTYLDALPKLIDPADGRLHTSFNQAVASTGRISSSDPNLQNIPIRTEQGRRIRDAFIAPSGRVLVTMDYSQIELRVLAHLSDDPNLTSAFSDGVDVHRRTAAEVFGVPEAQVDSEQRRIAKAVNFGIVYGQTAFGLAQQLGIPRGKAGSYIRAHSESMPGVDAYMKDLITIATERGFAETILGRRRRIPELKRKGAARGHGERIARNTPIQGSAADILKLAMIRIESALVGVDWARMLLTVHDELIFECDESRVDELVELCRPLMENAVKLKVPLVVDAGHGLNWGACKS